MIEQLQLELLEAGLSLDKVNEIIKKAKAEIDQIVGRILLKENGFINRY